MELVEQLKHVYSYNEIYELLYDGPVSFDDIKAHLMLDCHKPESTARSYITAIRGGNGAVKWLGKDKVVLALNDRRKYADTFWFALFHELGHVLQQRVKVLLVSEKNKAGLETDALIQKLETEADLFSQDTLIPKDEYLEFIEDNPRGFTSDSVRAFAKKINILPGIVVGRLQQDQYLTYQTNLNSLKIKYMIS